jgi:hypothetical protein
MVQGQGRGRHTFLRLFLLLQYLGLVGRSIPTKGPEERRHSPLVQTRQAGMCADTALARFDRTQIATASPSMLRPLQTRTI